MHTNGKKPKPRRGRPPRTAEAVAAAKERRIAPSRKGRLKFGPGDAHVLDMQLKEARNYRALITAKLDQLQVTLAALDPNEDPSATISAQEVPLIKYLWTTYEEHKHRDHIVATFLAIRREHLYAKLEAIETALQMAVDLLAPDDRLLEELRAAVDHQQQVAARMRPSVLPVVQNQDENEDENQTEESDQPIPKPDAALVRVTGPDEETVRAQLALARSERERQVADLTDPTQNIDHRHIYGDHQRHVSISTNLISV